MLILSRVQRVDYISRYFRMYSNMRVKVPVKQGILVGQRQQLPNGLQYDSFLGVPYAQPPLGELRFRSPVPLERFDQPELDCSKERSVSFQRDPFLLEIVGSENCLFLNVYAPKSKSQQRLPVMVWIHGGGFLFGNGNSDYHFPAQLMQEEVIVVTLNYRLGPLGFLSIPGAGIHGNAGLKDQRLALQWVHDNIANFNGDPQNVTLFGESAGGASVHLHTYASHANNLFHKAIMQSGTGNMDWVFQKDPSYKARRMAELLQGKNIEKDEDLLRFLQSDKVTPLALLAKSKEVLTADERRRQLPLAFKPVIEDSSSSDSFINTQFLDLLHERDCLHEMPLMMGYNSAEGIAMLLGARHKLELYNEDLARLVPRNLVVRPEAPEAFEAADDIRQFYFNGLSVSPERLDNLVDVFSDYFFNIDLQHAAEIHVNCQTNAPLYFFRFDYVGGRNLYKRLCQAETLRGAAHADDLSYLFQMKGDESKLEPADALMSQRMCHMWANFAKCGRPLDSWTPVQRPQRTASGELEPFQLDYMQLDRECGMKRNPDAERMDFWRSMYKRYRPDCYEALRAKL